MNTYHYLLRKFAVFFIKIFIADFKLENNETKYINFT